MQTLSKERIESTDLIQIDEVSSGECPKIFKDHIERLILNAIDPLTSYKAKRKLTIKAEFLPAEDRQQVGLTLSSSFTLAGKRAKKTSIQVGKRNGAAVASEFASLVDPMDSPEFVESGYENAHSMVTLSNLGGGAVLEKWVLAMEDVAYNILDPNTEATAKRFIRFELEFAPTEDYSMASGSYNVTTQLAALRSVPFSLRFSDGDGNTVIATEQRLEQTSLTL